MPALFFAGILLLASGTSPWKGPGSVLALPHGGQVTSGSGTILSSGNRTTIRQISNTLLLHWNSYNIAGNQTVAYLQPGASSVALNFIGGRSASQIFGHLTANGQIFLMNPNGIVFGPTAEVNVGGLVAAGMTLERYAAGSRSLFSGNGPVTNAGTITALPGGTVALLGGTVSNAGTIVAPSGTIALGAGNQVSLDFSGRGLVDLVVDQNTTQSVLDNGGILRADGGQILLKAGAQDSLLASVVNNTGLVEARTLGMQGGKIVLLSGKEAGTTNVSGTLDASAPDGGNGGSIETSGERVNVAPGTVVTTDAPFGKTGSWLIDPANYTIAASGGDITGTQLDSLLATNNLTIDSVQGASGSSGDIFVNTALSWSGNSLTLSAYRNIEFNPGATITVSGGGRLNARADDTGIGTGTVIMNGGSIAAEGSGTAVSFYYDPSSFSSPSSFSGITPSGGATFTPYMLVNDAAALGSIGTNLAGDYALGKNIDAASFSNPSPIGSLTSPFTGTFNGNNLTISHLTMTGTTPISATTPTSFGLFAENAGTIENLTLSDLAVTGHNYWFVGGLAGQNTGTIRNVSVTGESAVTQTGTATNYYWSVGAIAGTSGVAGRYRNISSNGYVENNTASISNASVSSETAVTGVDNTGGLVGMVGGGTVSESASGASATTTIDATSLFGIGVGGLVGWAVGGTIENSASTGQTSSSRLTSGYDVFQGGFAGAVGGEGDNPTLTNDISSGSFTAVAGATVGGFNGYTYASGGTLRNTFWNITASGVGTSSGNSTGLTSAHMQTASYFPTFSFSTVWQMGDGGPVLRAPVTPISYNPVTMTLGVSSKVYDGTTAAALSGTPSISGLLPGDSLALSGTASLNFTSPNVAANIPVRYNGGLSLEGASQSDYLLAGLSALVSAAITPAPLTVTGLLANNKVYDGTTSATLSGIGTLSGLVGTQSLTLSGPSSVIFSSPDAGSALTVTAAGYTIQNGSGQASNYHLSSESATTTASIYKAPLTLSGSISGPSRTYDGGTEVSLTPSDSNATLLGFVPGQGATYAGATGTFDSAGPGGDIGVSSVLTLANFTPAGTTNFSNYSFGSGTISGTGTIHFNRTDSLPSDNELVTTSTLTLSGPIQTIGATMNGADNTGDVNGGGTGGSGSKTGNGSPFGGSFSEKTGGNSFFGLDDLVIIGGGVAE